MWDLILSISPRTLLLVQSGHWLPQNFKNLYEFILLCQLNTQNLFVNSKTDSKFVQYIFDTCHIVMYLILKNCP
jgi:hypothetical protein